MLFVDSFRDLEKSALTKCLILWNCDSQYRFFQIPKIINKKQSTLNVFMNTYTQLLPLFKTMKNDKICRNLNWFSQFHNTKQTKCLILWTVTVSSDSSKSHHTSRGFNNSNYIQSGLFWNCQWIEGKFMKMQKKHSISTSSAFGFFCCNF